MNFKEFITKYKGTRVYIQTHNFPDPDALCSAYGLKKLCEEYDVTATLCYDGKIDKLSTLRTLEIFQMEIFSKEQLLEMTTECPIILVDSQKSAGNVTDLIGDEVACIDHHPTDVEISYQYKDVQFVGACSTIVASYYKEFKMQPDTFTATALVYGIKMDTNQFTRGVTEKDIEMYAFLNPHIDSKLLQSVTSNVLEFSDLQAFGAAFQTVRVFEQTGIAYIPFACPDALIAMISDFILELDQVNFAIVYAKREREWKFSIRSNTALLDAGNIIKKALTNIGNGGGHACMAGGLIPTENIKSLGISADTAICERFLDAIHFIL